MRREVEGRIAAKADANAELKTSAANAKADEKSARIKANKQGAEARQEAAEAKLAAQYGVAKEQCDIYASGAKDVCLDQAKQRFGKP